jgi:hypothetical protein
MLAGTWITSTNTQLLLWVTQVETLAVTNTELSNCFKFPYVFTSDIIIIIIIIIAFQSKLN